MIITIYTRGQFFKVKFIDKTILISKMNGLERVKNYFRSITQSCIFIVKHTEND